MKTLDMPWWVSCVVYFLWRKYIYIYTYIYIYIYIYLYMPRNPAPKHFTNIIYIYTHICSTCWQSKRVFLFLCFICSVFFRVGISISSCVLPRPEPLPTLTEEWQGCHGRRAFVWELGLILGSWLEETNSVLCAGLWLSKNSSDWLKKHM